MRTTLVKSARLGSTGRPDLEMVANDRVDSLESVDTSLHTDTASSWICTHSSDRSMYIFIRVMSNLEAWLLAKPHYTLELIEDRRLLPEPIMNLQQLFRVQSAETHHFGSIDDKKVDVDVRQGVH